jgi:hypothetical protein
VGLLGLAGAWAEEQRQDADRRHVVQRRDNLMDLAARYYGHPRYADVIALHNNILEPGRLRVGTELRVPDLRTLLEREKLASTCPDEVALILEALARYRSLRAEDWRLDQREGSGLPAATRRELLTAADELGRARVGLGRERVGVTAAPRSMQGQLASAERILERLAAGERDGYGYDVDLVEQHLAHAFLNGIHWARAGFR